MRDHFLKSSFILNSETLPIEQRNSSRPRSTGVHSQRAIQPLTTTGLIYNYHMRCPKSVA